MYFVYMGMHICNERFRIQTGFLDKSVCKTLRLACVCMYKFMCVYVCGCDSFGKLTLVCVFFFWLINGFYFLIDDI